MKRGLTALIAASVAMLAACDDGDQQNREGAATTTNASVVATSQPVVAIEHQPGSGDYTGALDDIDNLTCQQTDAGWMASGIATNPTDGNVDYRIYVSFLDGSGETIGVTETNVLGIAPNTGGEWSVTLGNATANLQCVLRVERRVS